jgi:hypothetical protein
MRDKRGGEHDGPGETEGEENARMMITRMALPRRTVLRGIGTALALPFLDAMVPAFAPIAKTAANPARRLGFVYVPNGMAMNRAVNHWKPLSVNGAFEFSPILKSLEPVGGYLTVVTGLNQRQAEAFSDGGGDHSRASASWLSGVHPKQAEGADVRAATTLDQVAADTIGKDTPLPSLELSIDRGDLVGNCDNGYSCVYVNTLSWRTPTAPLPAENNPAVVFERLFGDGDSAGRVRDVQNDRSILDAVSIWTPYEKSNAEYEGPNGKRSTRRCQRSTVRSACPRISATT